MCIRDRQLEEAVYSWGVVVESGYAQFVPQFEYLGNESVVSLYRGFLNGMETGSATAEQSAREAALLIGLGYGENLENALEAHYPAVSDALAGMFEDNNYIDLKQLASEFGFEIGDLMIITDHINYFPEHPLRGKNIPYGPRFPDMSEAYDKELIRKADAIAAEKGIKVQHGVYIGTQGPTFETPAEYKMFHILGADAVGMSTVPEVIVANHCGIKVFGVSVITDLGVEGKIVEVSHEEVQKAADEAQPRMTEIMRELINRA